MLDIKTSDKIHESILTNRKVVQKIWTDKQFNILLHYCAVYDVSMPTTNISVMEASALISHYLLLEHNGELPKRPKPYRFDQLKEAYFTKYPDVAQELLMRGL